MFLNALLFFLLLTDISGAERCSLNPGIYDFKIGNITGTVLSDGPLVLPNNPFLIDDEVVHRSYRENFRHSDPFAWSQNVVLLDTAWGRILVDTGAFNTPEFPIGQSGGQLAVNLKAAGISHKSIDVIMITHAHPDHVGGLTTIHGEAAFPNADVYISDIEHEFFSRDPVPTPHPSNTFAPIGRLGAMIYISSNSDRETN